MSNINRNNYEAFLLDYVEQNLSLEVVAELMLFLEQNSDLKAELEAFEKVTFTADPSTKFYDKETLKQVAIEKLMIAEIEKLNTPQETKEFFEEIAQNSTYKKLFSTYQKTILTPTPIVFGDKSLLKHKEAKVIPLFYWMVSAAAVLLLFLIIKNFNNDKIEKISSTIEPTQPVKNEPKITLPYPLANGRSVARNFKPQITNFKSQIPNLKSQISNPKSQTSNLKSQISNLKSQIPNPKPPISNLQSTIYNLQSTISSEHLATNAVEPIRKDSITIEPLEKQYIIIESLVMNEESAPKDDYLSVGELLKKEAQKRILATETKNAPTELVAANLVAKVFGKSAEIETKENIQGETEEYALNIGGFSFSRKIRK